MADIARGKGLVSEVALSAAPARPIGITSKDECLATGPGTTKYLTGPFLSRPSRLSESNPFAGPVFVSEFDPRGFKRLADSRLVRGRYRDPPSITSTRVRSQHSDASNAKGKRRKLPTNSRFFSKLLDRSTFIFHRSVSLNSIRRLR